MQTIRNLRSERRMNASDLAARAGIAKATLWQIEQGQVSPTLRTLEKIARALGCEVTDLIADERGPKTEKTVAV
jgi:transcriptional regulator with XRE-family HTH domain